MGSPGEVRGATAVAVTFSGRALGAQPALIDGAVGTVWAVGGRPKVAWDLTLSRGKIAHIEMLAAPDNLNDLDLTILDDGRTTPSVFRRPDPSGQCESARNSAERRVDS